MMLGAKRPLLAGVLAATLMTVGMAPLNANARDFYAEDRPGEFAVAGDILIARPVLTVVTALGLVAYTVTLPFSALGGNVDDAGETLVKAPARSAFLRCLGCTPAQHEQQRAMRKSNQ